MQHMYSIIQMATMSAAIGGQVHVLPVVMSVHSSSVAKNAKVDDGKSKESCKVRACVAV
jgi:hypothetical protein